MDPKPALEKLDKGEPLADNDCLALLTKASDPNEGPKIIPQYADKIFDAIQKMYTTDYAANANAAMYLTSALSGYSQAVDKDFQQNNLAKIIQTLDVLFSDQKGLSVSNWETVASLLSVAIAQFMVGKTKFYPTGIPMVIKGLSNKRIQGSLMGIISQVAMSTPRQLTGFVDQLVPAIKHCPFIVGSLADVYKQKPDLWNKHVPALIEYFADFDDTSRIGILTLLYPIAENNAALVRPILQNPDFKECLFSRMTGSSAGLVLKNIAVSFPADFVDWVDDLVDAIKSNDTIAWAIYGVFGNIGMVDETQAKRMNAVLFQLIQEKPAIQTVGQALMAVKNIQSKFPTAVAEYIPVLKQLIENSPFPEVKELSKGLIATAESRDLDSLHTQVQTNTQDIKEVQTKVVEQDKKIEAVEKTTAETQQRMDTVEVQVQETRQEVKQVSERVDKVETKVEEQGQQIKQILDRFDEMNAKVQESCKSYDELKAYVDKNVDMLKEFIAEVSKKLPQPYNFTANGKIIRTMTLWFECSLHEDGCMYNKEHPFKTDTKDWAKWLKVGFSLMKLGKAVYDKSLLDAYGACKEIYDTMSDKEDANFVSFISQPFLTSQEQDNLINQLRDQRFFDLFAYHAYSASWCCVKCAKRDKDRREGKFDTPQQTQEVTAQGSNNSNNNTASSPSSPKVSPTSSSNAGSGQVTGTLKIKRGLLGRMQTYKAIYQDGELRFWDPNKKGPGKPAKVMNKKDIVNFIEVDPRVAKRENVFNLVTAKKTHELEAPNKEELQMWKITLSP